MGNEVLSPILLSQAAIRKKIKQLFFFIYYLTFFLTSGHNGKRLSISLITAILKNLNMQQNLDFSVRPKPLLWHDLGAIRIKIYWTALSHNTLKVEGRSIFSEGNKPLEWSSSLKEKKRKKKVLHFFVLALYIFSININLRLQECSKRIQRSLPHKHFSIISFSFLRSQHFETKNPKITQSYLFFFLSTYIYILGSKTGNFSDNCMYKYILRPLVPITSNILSKRINK